VRLGREAMRSKVDEIVDELGELFEEIKKQNVLEREITGRVSNPAR
jgi:hypothetical protein